MNHAASTSSVNYRPFQPDDQLVCSRHRADANVITLHCRLRIRDWRTPPFSCNYSKLITLHRRNKQPGTFNSPLDSDSTLGDGKNRVESSDLSAMRNSFINTIRNSPSLILRN